MRTKEWTRQEIEDIININYNMLTKAILLLFERQTKNEQKHWVTNVHNNIGFNHADAKFFSSIASQLKNNKHLTDKQIYVCRKRIKKYGRQLTEIANEKLKQRLN